jgi:hypothetical protein
MVMIGAFGSELAVFGFVCGDNAGTMSTDRPTMKSGRHIALDTRILIGKSVYMNRHLRMVELRKSTASSKRLEAAFPL